MTINKSQGQSLSMAGIDLREVCIYVNYGKLFRRLCDLQRVTTKMAAHLFLNNDLRTHIPEILTLFNCDPIFIALVASPQRWFRSFSGLSKFKNNSSWQSFMIGTEIFYRVMVDINYLVFEISSYIGISLLLLGGRVAIDALFNISHVQVIKLVSSTPVDSFTTLKPDAHYLDKSDVLVPTTDKKIGRQTILLEVYNAKDNIIFVFLFLIIRKIFVDRNFAERYLACANDHRQYL
ncbi:hypothetical protein AGLY_001563 [Aphis glycines]|uniref:Uncharacterized protein n=1 Tax=Aphis glycines TaxID=307491 RepID=A0A6G0U5N1_APHGL|nr:hypothetical protein AGLY_001563 [Aphis glycines]